MLQKRKLNQADVREDGRRFGLILARDLVNR